MANRIQGFLASTPTEQLRILAADGNYVDIEADRVLSAERSHDHESGLEVWSVEYEEDAARPGRLDPDDFDRLFVTDVNSPLAAVAGRYTQQVHCPPTVPIAVCEESRHGPCF